MMVDSKDLEAEIHPLRSEDGKPAESVRSPSEKEEPGQSGPKQTRLSRCRTVAFFLSLFLCLLVAFVVSFIIPCPERPASRRTWRVDRNSAAAYDFLALEDLDGDRVQDVLFLYKKANSSLSNRTCADEGFFSPCAFAAAVSGASGDVLWERPLAQEVTLARCTSAQQRASGALPACVLVDGPGSVTAVDPFTGGTLWSSPGGLGANASALSVLLGVPDVDSDGHSDLLLVTREEEEVNVHFYSGSSGSPVGSRGRLGMDWEGSAALHVTGSGAHYLLFLCAGSLCGRSVKSLLEGATGAVSLLRTDLLWDRAINATTHRVPAPSSGAIRYQMAVPGQAGVNVLLVGSEACVLLDGQDLTPRWTLTGVQTSRKPVLGHYKPDTLAVAIENGTRADRQILLLDLGTGAVLWRQPVPGLPRGPPPASLLTVDHRSAFFFWGLPEGEGTNQTETRDAPYSLYMVHPTLPGVRLELANISSNILAFTAVLLEPSRHAAYIVLTGPESAAGPGLVSLTKHKVKDSIAGSRVVHLGHERAESDQAVRDRFSRLRYQREV